MPDRDATIVDRLEIDCEAEGSANLVVSSVALSNIPGLVVVDQDARHRTQRLEQTPARLSQLRLLEEWQYRGFIRRDPRVKPQHNPGVRFAVDIEDFFFIIGVD